MHKVVCGASTSKALPQEIPEWCAVWAGGYMAAVLQGLMLERQAPKEDVRLPGKGIQTPMTRGRSTK